MRRAGALALLVLVVAVPAADARVDAAARTVQLGHAGNAARFEAQTGQDSVVRHAFLGWEQGMTWGSRLPVILESLRPVPMIHLGTGFRNTRREAITPLQVANGAGDAYLRFLRDAIKAYGKLVYVRPMAEMNHPNALYSPRRKNDAAHSPAAYRKMFCRIYRALHDGNPASRLIVIWNPLAGLERTAKPAQEFYPGDGCVDWVGNDMFATHPGVASWDAAERLYAAHPSKPYAFPEWGLEGIDDPGFVERMCDFVRSHPRVRMLAYFEAKPGSRYDLGSKPKSAAAYRRCLTPMGAPAPAGGGGGVSVPATIRPLPPGQLSLQADPASGAAPLDVTFSLGSGIGRIARWQLVFGDGKVAQGNGEPPGEVSHTYERDGLYHATLIVYQAPPFVGTAIRFLTHARVRVGDDPGAILSLEPRPASGKAPLKVVFRASTNTQQPVVSWHLLYGDGGELKGQGKPPSFLGHTYKQKGAYRAVLIVHLAPPFSGTAVRFLTFADVRVT